MTLFSKSIYLQSWLLLKKALQHVVLVILLGLSYLSTLQACELSARVYNFPPLGIKLSEGGWLGLDIDYYDALLHKVNCDVKLLEMPFARALKMAEFGKLDLIMNITRTPEREKYLYFIGPIRDEAIVLATSTNFPHTINHLEQIADINGLVGLQRGIYLGEAFNQLKQTDSLFKSKILSVSNTTSLIELLKKGRIVAFFEEASHLTYQVENHPQFKNTMIQPLIVTHEPVYMAFSKKSVSVELINKLRQANEQLINEGVYYDIEHRYIRQQTDLIK